MLPTTPLLLLASFFFARSSERFENWFRSTRLYHKYLENFLERRAMTLPAKIAIQLVGLSAHGRRLPGREPLVDEGHPGGAGPL